MLLPSCYNTAAIVKMHLVPGGEGSRTYGIGHRVGHVSRKILRSVGEGESQSNIHPWGDSCLTRLVYVVQQADPSLDPSLDLQLQKRTPISPGGQ